MAEYYRQFWRHRGSTAHFVPVIMLCGAEYTRIDVCLQLSFGGHKWTFQAAERPRRVVQFLRLSGGLPRFWSDVVRRGPIWSSVVRRGPPSDPAVWTWCLTETMPHLASVMEDDH